MLDDIITASLLIPKQDHHGASNNFLPEKCYNLLAF